MSIPSEQLCSNLRFPYTLSDKFAQFQGPLCSDTILPSSECQTRRWNLAWTWLPNTAINLLSILLSPIVALVNLVAALIFSCLKDPQKAKLYFANSVGALTDDLATACARLVVFHFQNPHTCRNAINSTSQISPEQRQAIIQNATNEDRTTVDTVIRTLRHYTQIVYHHFFRHPSLRNFIWTNTLDPPEIAAFKRNFPAQFKACAAAVLAYPAADQLLEAIIEASRSTGSNLSLVQLTSLLHSLTSSKPIADEAVDRVLSALKDSFHWNAPYAKNDPAYEARFYLLEWRLE